VSHPGPTQVVLRQVRAVRRRNNAHVAQHAAGLWVSTAAIVATVVVLSALRGGRVAFELVALAGVVAVCAATALLARRVEQRWLRARAAPGRIDAARELRGRLTSVLELEGRARGDFFALLLRQNVDALPRWRPEDVVPDVIPVRAFAGAVVAICALALTIVLAPVLRRPPPRVSIGDRRMDFVTTHRTSGTADRLLVTPGTDHTATQREAAGAADDARDEENEPGTLADASEKLQDWLQQALGVEERWEAGEPVPSGTRQDGARAPRPQKRPAGTPVTDDGAMTGEGKPIDAQGPASRHAGEDAGEPGPGGAGSGAGADADPTLFGEPHDEGAAGGDRFELAIAARVHARQGTAPTPWTDSPAVDRDRHPALAGRQWAEQPGHRMPVSRTFAPIVRRIFAHVAQAQGESP